MRLRQIALVAENLASAEADVMRLFGVRGGYRDPGVGAYGLANIVLPIGDTFLEVVSPKEPGTTAGRLLDKRGGDGGYMVILQVPDFATARRRLDEQGARVVSERHGDCFDFAHIHPKDIGGAIVSIDEMRPPEHWEWGGPNWRDCADTSVVKAIVGAEIQGADPDALCARWSAVLGIPAGGRVIPLDGGVLRFVEAPDGRGEGLGGIDVALNDAPGFRRRAEALGAIGSDGVVTVCGTRLYGV